MHSDDDCGGMERLLRHLAPGTAVSVWFDSSGFITTTFQLVRDDLAAFTGGALDRGLTYVPVCAIRALRLGELTGVTGETPAGAAVEAETLPGAGAEATPSEVP